jgi:uncharacterized protein
LYNTFQNLVEWGEINAKVVPAVLSRPLCSKKQTLMNKTGIGGFNGMDPNKHKDAARKGGLKVSENRAWMAEIGRKGGVASGKKRTAAAQAGLGLPTVKTN